MSIQRLPSINGLRAISILMVLFHHLEVQHILTFTMSSFKWLIPILHFVQDGQLGVNIFFVISGFLITTLLLHEEKITKTISIKNFFIRRTLRIFPAYFFLLFIYGVLQFMGFIHIHLESWITAVTYTKYFNWQSDWYTAHAWSLSVEEHFYLLWPFVFVLGDFYRKRITILLIIIVPIMRIYIGLDSISWYNELTIFTRIDAILMGCIVALYKNEVLNYIKSYWKLVFYSSIFLLLSLSILTHYLNNHYIHYFLFPISCTIGSVSNAAISLLLLYSIYGPKSVWHKFLNLNAINYIGLLSYSIYLWQQVFMVKTTMWFNQFPANIGCIMLAALGSYYLIEKPFLRFKSRFNEKRY